jgi:hypothetical protein
MLIYWEKNTSGVQEVNCNIEEDNERCQIHKPHMKNDEDKKQIIDPMLNIVFIFDLQKNNNCNNARFWMQKSTYDMLRLSVESITIFVWSSRVFTQLSKLWARSIEI